MNKILIIDDDKELCALIKRKMCIRDRIYTTEVYANRIEFAGAKMVDRPPFPEDAEGFLEIPEGMEEEMPFR